MERSKGKLNIYHSPSSSSFRHIYAGDEKDPIVVAAVKGSDAEANALHLVKCWNAFEKDGLVGEMKQACRDAYLDLVKGNIEDTQAGKILKAVLTRYTKEAE